MNRDDNPPPVPSWMCTIIGGAMQLYRNSRYTLYHVSFNLVTPKKANTFALCNIMTNMSKIDPKVDKTLQRYALWLVGYCFWPDTVVYIADITFDRHRYLQKTHTSSITTSILFREVYYDF